MNGGATCPNFNVIQSCPVDCVVDYPQTWGPCSSSGFKTMTGTVIIPQLNGGANCPPLNITESCVYDGPQYI